LSGGQENGNSANGLHLQGDGGSAKDSNVKASPKGEKEGNTKGTAQADKDGSTRGAKDGSTRDRGKASVQNKKPNNLESKGPLPKLFWLSEKPVRSFCGHTGDILDLSWSNSKVHSDKRNQGILAHFGTSRLFIIYIKVFDRSSSRCKFQ
jgi:hypothetical protein